MFCRSLCSGTPDDIFVAMAFAIIATTGVNTHHKAHAVVTPAPIERHEFRAQLADFTTRAELTVPGGASKPLPAVLLIHGAFPEDMDFTVMGFDGRPVSHIFRDLADSLSARGFAVVRYDKRYVSGVGQVDRQKFAALTLQDLVADAHTMLDSMRANPRIDRTRIFVYGWSEGSAIAAQLVMQDPSLRGLIVQGPVVHSFAATLREQFPRVGAPYLQRFAKDGKVDLAALNAAMMGDGGLVAKSQAMLLYDPTSPQERKLNAWLDQNHDGMIDIAAEAQPAVAAFFANPAALGAYADGQALPGLLADAPKLTMPVLVLQGLSDANVPAEWVRELEQAMPAGDHTFKYYEGLGHSLGTAKDVEDDAFRPIDPKPIADVAAWLTAESGRR